MLLQTERIFLRAPEPSDLEFLYLFENDTDLWPVSMSVTPLSRDVLRQYLDNATADIFSVRQLRLIICLQENQAVLGTIDLFDFDPMHLRAGVGIALAGPHRGKGFAQEALQLLLTYASTTLHLHQLYCTVAIGNERSQRLFQHHGFVQIGIRKDWLRTAHGWEDVIDYQRLLPPNE